ncbi:ABC transporter substrate-binding protein [Martelella endophytica]|uniref:ABC transporter substrate-binding protein n=1 Tax=Martelella endophytica TaxID=1486262 RepID=A0A0D5LSX0_MAREN|nr:ABC transporter substrate-binding protein [Martelella endophytica]AJY47304.1 ABC transporter substrate-binding protein [Martelella endophytica]
MKRFASMTLAAVLISSAAYAAPVELTLWHMEQPPQRVQRIQEMLDAFNDSHPDISVSQEPQSWGEVYAKAPAALAAGAGPDMIFTIPDFTPVLKDLGKVQSVADFVEKLDSEHHFIPATLEPYTYDDGVWAVPLYNMSMNMWYRKSEFEKAGISVPETWDDWLKAAETLATSEMYGIGVPANKQLYTDQTIYSVMANGGASELYNEDGTLRFDNPETVAAYDFYSKLVALSPPDVNSWTWGEAEACFTSKSCGMIMQFSVISTYDTQGGGAPEDLGIAAIPTKNAGGEHNTIAYPNGVMLLTDDKAKTEAFETFVSWLLEPENYGKFLNMEPGLFMPVTEDGAKAESFWSDPMVEKYKPQIETAIANSKNGKLFGFTSGRIFPSIAAISAQNLLAATVQDVTVSGDSAADAVAAGQKTMEEAAE